METLKPIKATAVNRGKPRIWIERDLSKFGFRRGTPITITVSPEFGCIIIEADPSGDRIMAGRTKNGKELHILDITCSHEAREAIRKNCAKFAVKAEVGKILITPDFSTQAKQQAVA